MKWETWCKLPFLTALWICILTIACAGRQTDVRPAAVAGQFYPSDPAKLRLAVESFLRDALPGTNEKPIAIVAPHAGYIFSGQICADAFKRAAGRPLDLVVILGTNHTVAPFRRVAALVRGGMQTPLGRVEIDSSAAAALLAADKNCVADAEPHRREHSVEVQLPFIQVLFPAAKVLPLVIGSPAPEICTRLGKALAAVLKNRQALIVASSDLSHYPAYKEAQRIDHETIQSILAMDPQGLATRLAGLTARGTPNLDTTACGEAPIMAAMSAAKLLGASHATLVSYANSGDAAVGERDRVVGYCAVAFAAGPAPVPAKAPARPAPGDARPLEAAEKEALLKIARSTIKRYLATETAPLVRNLPPRLNVAQGAFVTLRKHGELRGCIGHIPPDMPLGMGVGAMSMQAACNDPRFPPLSPGELEEVEIEISALTPPKPISAASDIVVGRDGVVLMKAGRSAVFLPQVARENGWNREEMLDNLCVKAGLPRGSWEHGAQFMVFQAEVFSESRKR